MLYCRKYTKEFIYLYFANESTMSRRNNRRDYAGRANKREQQSRKNVHRAEDWHYASGEKNGAEGNGQSTPNGSWKDASNPGWQRFKDEQLARMPRPLPRDRHKKVVNVFVEGYEDISFWRNIFDNYESPRLTFEIGVPPREDLAKGKKVLMGMLPESSETTLLCVDSDFDHLFGDRTEQSKIVTGSEFMFHTYAYATENFLCYAPSLHNVCVKATKNDTRIFDFEKFMAEYSRTIYPLFIWYAYSAQLKNENFFTLVEFKSSVKLNYLEVRNNGASTLSWLQRQVHKRLEGLHKRHSYHEDELLDFHRHIEEKGVTQDNAYMYVQGHTLMDNVVMVMLSAVCEELKSMSNIRINTSTKTGTALKNELSNYNNALRSVRDVLLSNEACNQSPQYKLLQDDIEHYLTKYNLRD